MVIASTTCTWAGPSRHSNPAPDSKCSRFARFTRGKDRPKNKTQEKIAGRSASGSPTSGLPTHSLEWLDPHSRCLQQQAILQAVRGAHNTTPRAHHTNNSRGSAQRANTTTRAHAHASTPRQHSPDAPTSPSRVETDYLPPSPVSILRLRLSIPTLPQRVKLPQTPRCKKRKKNIR